MSDIPIQAGAITPEERRRREEAVAYARASVELSGFKSDPRDEELSRRYIAGEITIEEALKAVDESCRGR
jgi:hypothetical protein